MEHLGIHSKSVKGLMCLMFLRRKPTGTAAWNSKQPLFYGCFKWMIPNHCIENCGFAKHPLKTGCLEFQVVHFFFTTQAARKDVRRDGPTVHLHRWHAAWWQALRTVTRTWYPKRPCSKWLWVYDHTLLICIKCLEKGTHIILPNRWWRMVMNPMVQSVKSILNTSKWN